jgi:hypothetical protein
MENNNFIKILKNSWSHKPVSQPTLLGNRCPDSFGNEPYGQWCHPENSRPNELKYTVPVNDNEPFSNVANGMIAPVNEFLPNSGLGMPSDNAYVNFPARENLSLCTLENSITDANDKDSKYFNWNNPEKLIYTEDLAPRCNESIVSTLVAETPVVTVPVAETPVVTVPVAETPVVTVPVAETTQIEKFETIPDATVQTNTMVIIPVETKKCKSAQLNMALIRDILILIGLIGFVILMIYIIRRYGKITEDLTSSNFSLSFEDI